MILPFLFFLSIPPAMLNSDQKESKINQECTALVPYIVHSPIQQLSAKENNIKVGSFDFIFAQNWAEHGVAGVLWDASIVLSEFLYANPVYCQGKTVLELGAGTALPSIVCALLDAEKVYATDLATALPVLEANVAKNSDLHQIALNKIQVMPLKWGEDLRNLPETQLILAADVVYDESVFEDLLATFQHLVNNGKNEVNNGVNNGVGKDDNEINKEINSETKSGVNDEVNDQETRVNNVISNKEFGVDEEVITEILLSCRIRYPRDRKFLKLFKTNFDARRVFYDKARDIHLYLGTMK